MTYTFYADPGHGWLKVPMAELIQLGIASDISQCSYRDTHAAYLEEDSDMVKFFKAKGWTQWPTDLVTSRHLDQRCFVRRLPSYTH